MGKFEKLVVLTVLFAAAIVLAISFNRGKGQARAADPLAGADEILRQEGTPPEATPPLAGDARESAQESGKDASSETSLLLNAGPEGAGAKPPQASTTSQPAALSLEPAVDPTHRILKENTGLRPSFMDEFMVYTAVEGDTWSGLAQRFYQDGRYTRNLLRANDEMPSPIAGTQVLVPVYDLLSADAGLQVGSGASQEPAPAVLAAESTPGPKAPQVAPVAGKPLEYEVQPGDTLSEISLAVFGTSTRWNEILEANKDRLSKPEALQAGMKLRIPEGGKLPANQAGKTPDKKAEAKPKTAQTTPPPPAKKKKVL